MTSLKVIHGDILNHPCDLLILKHADGFFGVDKEAAERVGFAGGLEKGRFAIVPGRNTEARQLLFYGVGPLSDFRYAEIRKFGRDVLKVALDRAERPHRVCSPVHGPGYGLDESEAFLSLLGGFSDAIRKFSAEKSIEEVIIVESHLRRAEYFSTLLNEIGLGTKKHGLLERTVTRTSKHERQLGHEADDTLSNYGRASEQKMRLFVAMPFKKDYSDEWEISITEAARAADILCERIDEQSYTGDILAQIKKRIGQYNGVIALLNESNPNVFLELGFAWAREKPTILLAKEGEKLPFDVQGQRCITYSTIAELRRKLTTELAKLKAAGLFD